MTIYNMTIADSSTYQIPENKYDIILVYANCTTLVLPSIINSDVGFTITIINYDMNSKNIINELLQDTIKPNQTATYVRASNNSFNWVKIDNGIITVTDTSIGSSTWNITGNTGSGLLLGTTDSSSFNIIQNGTAKLSITGTGIDMLNNNITNIATPVNNGDAATKQYVDGLISSAWSLSGNTGGTALKLGTTTNNDWTIVHNNNLIATINSTNLLMNTGINMNNNIITGVATPVSATDAANKDYVDKKKNQSTLIVGMTTNTASNGLVAAASSTFSSSFEPFNVFTVSINEWISTTLTNYWISIKLLNAEILYKIVLTGRTGSVNESPATWRIDGSNDNFTTFTTIFTGPSPLTNTPLIFNIPYYSTKYQYYRLFALTTKAGGLNPGLSYWGLYSYIGD